MMIKTGLISFQDLQNIKAMKTIFIGIPDFDKTICRETALKYYYQDCKNVKIRILLYVDQPEGYFRAPTINGEIRFYQSPGQPEPYKVEYYCPFDQGAILIKISLEQWVLDIWDRLVNPDKMRNETLLIKQLQYGK